MSLSGVLFDKDGTLISFEKTWGPALGAVIATLAGGDAEKLAAQAAALHFSVEDQRFLPTSPFIGGSTRQFGQLWAEALQRDDYAALKIEIEGLSAAAALSSLTPIGAPVEIIRELRRLGLRIGVATNDSEASARRQIAALGLAEEIEFLFGYNSGHGAKPDPGMVRAFAARLGVKTERIAMVGDTLHDLDAARAAGAVAVAVLSGPMGRELLEPHADYVIEDISALPALAERLMGGGSSVFAMRPPPVAV